MNGSLLAVSILTGILGAYLILVGFSSSWWPGIAETFAGFIMVIAAIGVSIIGAIMDD